MNGGHVFGSQVRVSYLLLLVMLGCSEPPPPMRPPPADEPALEPSPAGPAYRAVELTASGSVAGVVRFTGEVPSIPALEVPARREICGDSQPSPVLAVDSRRGLADAVVSLDGIREGKPIEPGSQRFDRRGCRFVPHVAAVVLGSTIRFGSEDPLPHNARGTLEGERWMDVGLAGVGAEGSAPADGAGVLRLVCDAGHGWELAWLHVLPHPYFAVTDERGRFRIDEVPPGQYTLRVWHEGWRVVGREAGRPRYSAPVVMTRNISVIARQESTADFEIRDAAAEAAGD